MRSSCVLAVCALMTVPLVTNAYGESASDATKPIQCGYNPQANEKTQLVASKSQDQVPVGVALKAIIAGITCYQIHAAGSAAQQSTALSLTAGPTLLRLSKAVIDLKAVATKGVNGDLGGFAILVQGAHTSTKATDFSYSYQVPPPPPPTNATNGRPGFAATIKKPKPKPTSFTDQIANAMLLASDLAASSNIPGMKNTGFTVTLSVGVENKGTAGLTFNFLGITAGGGGSIDNNTTQQVTLTFGNPSPSSSNKS